MEQWMVYAKKADFDGLGKQFQISPILARIIRNRDVVTEKEFDFYLNGDLKKLYSPWLLKGMDEAVNLLAKKIADKKKIRVVSDYDIDGTCAGYILVEGIREIGGRVDLVVPDRVKDGYGMNVEMARCAFEDGVDTIITCDNGIAAIDAIKEAKELGLSVIVTDHHEVGYTEKWGEKEYILPEADVIVDPKQPGCQYPYKEICGATVAYKVIEALFSKFSKKASDAHKYLEYAGIATIGDVVDLLDENRVITKYGLLLLNRTTNIGLQELIRANDLEGKVMNSYHIGFVLGPCINAAGRLETAKMAFELLSAKNRGQARSLAKKLTDLNNERKAMTNEGVEMAKEELAAFEDYPVLVIYLPELHESVAGIVAGRIREMTYKPTIILTNGKEGVKGSGRSIPGYHMFEELNRCRNTLKKFGGHAMAAGLSLEEDHIDVLRNLLNQNCRLEEEDFIEKIWIDVAMPFEYASMNFVNQLELLEPFGKGNEKPSFGERNISVRRIRIFGEKQDVIRLSLANSSDCQIDGVYFDNEKKMIRYLTEVFGEGEVEKAMMGRPNKIRINVIYYPQINEYNGYKSVQVVIKNFR